MVGPGIGATYRQNFESPSTAKMLPSCCVTAVKVPSKFDLPSTAKNLPSTLITYKNYRQLSHRIKTAVNTAYRIKTTVNTAYRIKTSVNTAYRPKGTKHWIPPKRHRHFFLVFMFSSTTHHIVGSHIHILWLQVTCTNNTYVIYCCD